MLNSYGDPVTDSAVLAERALRAELHGGCSGSVGTYAVPSGEGTAEQRGKASGVLIVDMASFSGTVSGVKRRRL